MKQKSRIRSRTRYLSVNRQAIVQNAKLLKPPYLPEGAIPPLRISTGKYGRPKHYFSMIIPGPVKVIYDPLKPMP